MDNLSFRNFMELQKVDGYLSKLDQELGIDVDTMKDSPQYLPNFSLDGKNTINMSMYDIVKYNRDGNGDVTSMVVKLRQPDSQKLYTKNPDGKSVLNPDNKLPDREYVIPVKKANKMLNPAASLVAAGAAPPPTVGGPPMVGGM